MQKSLTARVIGSPYRAVAGTLKSEQSIPEAPSHSITTFESRLGRGAVAQEFFARTM